MIEETSFIKLDNVDWLNIGETYVVAGQWVQVEEIEPDGIWVTSVALH